MTTSHPFLFTIGTRGSPLALAQARMVSAALAAQAGTVVATEVIRTSGDQIQDRALSEAGGKGLFTKEIDEAQLAGHVDIAVHSAKDLPTSLPDGLVIAGYLPREDARDVLVCRAGTSIKALPHGARIGSASLRRQAQLLKLRPDLRPELLRGNVATRIARVREGAIDATVLALAGLKRLGLAHEANAILRLEEFLPAVGQGAIALLARAGDERAHAAIARFACRDTAAALAAERAFLTVLDGSCRTPIAGHAWIGNGLLHLKGQVLVPDGSASAEGERSGAINDAALMGTRLGHELKRLAPAGALGGNGT